MKINLGLLTMGRARGSLLVFALAAAVTAPHARADTDIALNAPVIVAATDPDLSAGYNNGTAGNVGDITNGTFLPNGTQYWSPAAAGQALEWSGNGYVFQINLGATYQVCDTRKGMYKRIVLKLSGEVLAGPRGFGLDADKVRRLPTRLSMCTHWAWRSASWWAGATSFAAWPSRPRRWTG
jgi:hypothetical protein